MPADPLNTPVLNAVLKGEADAPASSTSVRGAIAFDGRPPARYTGTPAKVASIGGEASSSEPIEYLDLARYQVEGVPPVEWIAKGWLAKKDVAILAGAGGIGKSTALAALAHAIARGESWCGIETTGPMKVLVFDEEQGTDETVRLYLRLGDSHPNLAVASGQGIDLSTEAGTDRLERAIRDNEAQVVLLDSVQQVFGSTKENDATDVGTVYRRLFHLRDRYSVSFVLVHHKRKSQMGSSSTVDVLELVRGSTAHGTQASTVWYCAPGQDRSRLSMIQAKRRGASKTSLVIAYSSDGPEGPITLTGEGPVEDSDTAFGKAQEWLVEYLADQGVAKRAWIVEAGEKDNHGVSTLERALKTLLKLGTISQPRHGYYELLAHPAAADGNLTES